MRTFVYQIYKDRSYLKTWKELNNVPESNTQVKQSFSLPCAHPSSVWGSLYRLWTQFKLIKVNFRKLTFWTLISSDLFLRQSSCCNQRFETRRLESLERLETSIKWTLSDRIMWTGVEPDCFQSYLLFNHIFSETVEEDEISIATISSVINWRRPYFRWGFELNYFIFLKLFEGHQNRKLFWWYHYFISDVINSAYQCSSWNYSEINGLKIIFDAWQGRAYVVLRSTHLSIVIFHS